MRRAVLILQVVFWLGVAYIPLAIEREITDFMVSRGCMPGTECLNQLMPLLVQINLVGWAARVLLWPLSIWHLGGAWLWHRYRLRRSGAEVVPNPTVERDAHESSARPSP
jgi:hypothetical protein